MRIATRPLEADSEPWDPANPGPFRDLAGGQFLRAEGDLAVFRTRDGSEQLVSPGWYVVRPDGAAQCSVCSAEHVGTGGDSEWAPA